jgi:hypothetical protein
MTNRLKALMVAGLLSATAFAQEGDADHGAEACPGLAAGAAAVDEEIVHHWMVLDGDGEGLTKEQVATLSPELAAEFDALDRDHDGRLTVFELHHPMGADEQGTGTQPNGPEHAIPNAAPALPSSITHGTRI